MNRGVKGIVLRCKRWPFRVQYVAFYNAKDALLERLKSVWILSDFVLSDVLICALSVMRKY